MRHTFPREFYVPKSDTLKEIRDAESDAVAFTYETAGVLYALAFHGRAAKPDWHFRFASEERRASKIAEHAAGWRAHAAFQATRKAERSAPHPLKVGAILHTSWGYDQTNVEFFQVTRIVGPHTVELRELAQEHTSDGALSMSGSCKPIPGKYLEPRFSGDDAGLPIVRRASANGSVKISGDYRRAYPWDGQPKSWSSYA